MTRAAVVISTIALALVDGALVVAIVAGVALLGRRVQEQTSVQYAPPPVPAFSGSWRVPPLQESLVVANMRGGRHCWVYTPLGLDATRLRARALRTRVLCGSR